MGPVSPSSPQQTAVTDRLRSAGCVFAEDEAGLLIAAARTPAELGDLVEQRVEGRPLEHVLGWAELCGIRVAVDPGVFVPRRRTELLVRQAIDLALAVATPPPVIVDLCCGSGAVGVVLAATSGPVELHAVDIDPAAASNARRNLAAAGAHVHQGDLYAPLDPTLRGRVDILVANAPYVPTDAIGLLPQEARLHEARVALDGGTDGLDVHRRVAAAAVRWLVPGGHLLIETSGEQAAAAAEMFSRVGLAPRVVRSEELDATVVIGTKPCA